jgi:hypothetical protein
MSDEFVSPVSEDFHEDGETAPLEFPPLVGSVERASRAASATRHATVVTAFVATLGSVVVGLVPLVVSAVAVLGVSELAAFASALIASLLAGLTTVASRSAASLEILASLVERTVNGSSGPERAQPRPRRVPAGVRELAEALIAERQSLQTLRKSHTDLEHR